MKRYAAATLAVLLCGLSFPWSAEAAPKARFGALTVDNVVVDVRTFGFGVDNTAAQNKAAILAAIASLPSVPGNLKGGRVLVPGGDYNVAPGIEILRGGVTLEGAATGYSYQMNDNNGMATTLHFTGSGTYAFQMSADLSTANHYGKIKNMHVAGNSSISYGIGVEGGQLLEELTVSGFNLAGVVVYNAGNSTHISKVSASYNYGAGLIITEGATSTTALTVENSNFRRNGTNGIEIYSGQHMSFSNCTVEANYGLGLLIRRIAGNRIPTFIKFQSVWFEGNDDTAPRTGYQILIDSDDATSTTLVPQYIEFNQCSIVAETTHKNIHIRSARHVKFKDCNISEITSGGFVINATYALYTEIWGEAPVPASGEYGVAGVYFQAKQSGNGGIVTNGAVHAVGGRTMTLWFTTDNATLNSTTDNTLYLYPTATAGSALRDTLRTYAVPNSGSIVGMVVSKRYAHTVGTLTFTPYHQNDWGGAIGDYTTTMTLPPNTTHAEVTATMEADTWGDTSTTTNENHVGVRVNAPNPYTEGSDSKLVVGLIIEY